MTANSRPVLLRRPSDDAAAQSNRAHRGVADFRDCPRESGPQDGEREANIFPEKPKRHRRQILHPPVLPQAVDPARSRCGLRPRPARRVVALTMSGLVVVVAIFRASVLEFFVSSVPGSTGTPAAPASRRA